MTGVDPQLAFRIRGEFLEMPGLRLTVSQASKLWAMDPATSERLLEALRQLGFLARSASGAYARTSAG
jgi:DNA-binding IclR family transcriptional regulator